METRLKTAEMETVNEKLCFDNLLVVDCDKDGNRRSGDLTLLWNQPMDVTLMSFSLHHIDAEVYFSYMV